MDGTEKDSFSFIDAFLSIPKGIGVGLKKIKWFFLYLPITISPLGLLFLFSPLTAEQTSYLCNLLLGVLASLMMRIVVKQYDYDHISKVSQSTLGYRLGYLMHCDAKNEKKISEQAQEVLSKLGDITALLFFTWFILYLTKFLASYVPIIDTGNLYFNVFLDGLNVITTWAVFAAYMTLSRPKRFLNHSVFNASFGLVFVLIFILKVSMYAISSGALIGSFLLSFLAFISLALFVGRSDSRFVCPPSGMIVLLYVYAIVQLFPPIVDVYNVFHTDNLLHDEFISGVFLLAFIGKWVLYALITWAYITDRWFVAFARSLNWLYRLKLDRIRIHYVVAKSEGNWSDRRINRLKDKIQKMENNPPPNI